MATKPRTYRSEDLEVTYDLKRCIHAGECASGLPVVFDPTRRPWVDLSVAAPDEIAKVVMRCPSGALEFRRTDGGPGEPTPTTNEVLPAEHGPLYVHGDMEIHTPSGTIRAQRAAFCRCGASNNKPFCDGSHEASAFRAPATFALEARTTATGDSVVVSPRENGSLLFEGNVSVVDSHGAAVHLGPRTSFCRCGDSDNKPLCDGTHRSTGFEAWGTNSQRAG